MLQQNTAGAIVEQNYLPTTLTAGGAASIGKVTHLGLTTGCVDYSGLYQQTPIYWQSYPVYVCSDKTKKAIEVLKALQAEKLLTCGSVPRFIELVEKISAIL